MFDTAPLRDAYATLLDAAGEVAAAPEAAPPPGEWNADQILAHVSLVSAATITAACSVASGTVATYDNRIAQDPWTLDRVIAYAHAHGNAGLRERIRAQGEALCTLAERSLSEAELDTQVPALLLSNGKLMVDQPMPLRDLLTGLAQSELSGHTEQLLALR